MARWFLPYRYITPTTLRNGTLQYEASLFARHVLSQRELVAKGRDDSTYYINEKGYRGRNFTREKPEGTTRIIFYGGSTTFNEGSGRGKDWPHRVEKILRSNGFRNIEVINAGIPGHASFDSVGRLFAEGHVFEPDYVVLYNAWNDIKYFRSDEPLLRRFKPLDPTRDPRRNYHNAIDRFLGDRSHAYALARRKYYKWRLHVGSEGIIPSEQSPSEITEYGPRQYRLNLETFVDVARNIGAVPILMTQARLVVHDNSESEKKKIRYRYVNLGHDDLVNAFETTDQIAYSVAQQKGVPLIDASKALTGRNELFIDHVHFTEEGAKELARITARHMLEIIGRQATVQER